MLEAQTSQNQNPMTEYVCRITPNMFSDPNLELGLTNIQQALEFLAEQKRILTKYGFTARQWICTDQTIAQNYPDLLTYGVIPPAKPLLHNTNLHTETKQLNLFNMNNLRIFLLFQDILAPQISKPAKFNKFRPFQMQVIREATIQLPTKRPQSDRNKKVPKLRLIAEPTSNKYRCEVVHEKESNV